MGNNQTNDWKKIEAIKKEYMNMEMPQEQVEQMKQQIWDAKKRKSTLRRKQAVKGMAGVAAAVALFILLPNTSMEVAHAMSEIPVLGKLVEVVTFRDYIYESERQMADITVPYIVAENDKAVVTADTGASAEEGAAVCQAAGDVAATEEGGMQKTLKQSIQTINEEIQSITDSIIEEFEANMDEQGYQDVIVKSEVLNTTEEYFTLKLICYQGAGSGAEWDYYYTIDLNTGERLALADLFLEDADYITPISENIQSQMREQMAADDMVHYWVDEEEIPEWNFTSITDETSFYINENDNVVICFNEGDVAPMYMGCVEFEIPAEVLADIRK